MSLVLTESDLIRLMRSLGPRLIAVSRGICRDEQAAEDIVQEAFVKLWQRPPDGPEAVTPTWLRRVVVNLSINHIRRTRRVEALPEHSPDAALRIDHRPEDRVEMDEHLLILREALATLPDEKRAILMMRVSEKMSYQEIAESLDVPVGTVMSRLNRARAALRDEMERRMGEAGPEKDGLNVDPMVFPFRRPAKFG